MMRKQTYPENVDVGVPPEIFLRHKTLLCRWDTGCCGVDQVSDISDNLTTSSTESPFSPPQPKPSLSLIPKPPRRSSSPEALRAFSKKIAKAHEASLASGIDVKSIRLQSVDFLGTMAQPASSPLISPLSNILEISSSFLHKPAACKDRFVSKTAGTTDDTKNHAITAVFCIRRAGCGSCRHHGLELKRVTEELETPVNMLGIIKDNQDNGLEEFYSDYFPFPLYKDTDQQTFHFLGDRKLSMWKFFKQTPRLLRRYHRENIQNRPGSGGDEFTQGGILLFDRQGTLRFVYYEKYGDRLDTDALKWAIQECIHESDFSPVSTSFKLNAPRKPVRKPSKSDIVTG